MYWASGQSSGSIGHLCYICRIMIIRLILIVAGTLFLLLGIVGIFVPGLPTTPFFLLTAGLYVRSSDRLHQKLVGNLYFGSYIRQWQSNPRLMLKTKIRAILLMWIMISISVVLMIDSRILQLIIVALGLVGTLVMGFIIPSGNSK